MAPLAHSARGGLPAQSYREHVENVWRRASQFAAEAGRYAAEGPDRLQRAVSWAAEYHDLGKLLPENQEALEKDAGRLNKLPVNHVDAGTAFLLKPEQNADWSAVAVYSHHRGLPDFPEESVRGEGGLSGRTPCRPSRNGRSALFPPEYPPQ